MQRTSKTGASAVMMPVNLLAGLFSRLLFVFFLPIGVFMLIKAAVQKIRGVNVATESVPQAHLDPGMIGRTYFHQGHTWALPTAAGTVMVGFDDFTRKVMGAIDTIDLPKVGGFLKQGHLAWRLRHAGRTLAQSSPVEGTILEVNQNLVKQPSLAQRSRPDTSWVLKIRPTRLKENLRSLLHGELAEKWMAEAKSSFVQRFPQSAVPVFQDGGELIDGVGDTLTDDEWNSVRDDFFYTTT